MDVYKGFLSSITDAISSGDGCTTAEKAGLDDLVARGKIISEQDRDDVRAATRKICREMIICGLGPSEIDTRIKRFLREMVFQCGFTLGVYGFHPVDFRAYDRDKEFEGFTLVDYGGFVDFEGQTLSGRRMRIRIDAHTGFSNRRDIARAGVQAYLGNEQGEFDLPLRPIVYDDLDPYGFDHTPSRLRSSRDY